MSNRIGYLLAPSVSVILSVHNDRRYIGDAVRSVLDQTLADFELVIVDDGSTDGTEIVLDELARSEARIRLLRQKHRGLTISLGRAIGEARGVYLARQDSDDRSRPTRLARQVAFLETHQDVAAVGTPSAVIDEDGREIRTLTCEWGPTAVRRALLSLGSTLVHGSVMMRRNEVRDVGGYRPAFTASQDFDLWLRLSERRDLDNLPDVLYEWRLNPAGVYNMRRAEQLAFAAIALAFARERKVSGRDSYDMLEACGGDVETFLRQYSRGGGVHAQLGELLLRNGLDPAQARNHLGKALLAGCLQPRTVVLFGWSACGLKWPGGTPLSVRARV